MGDGHYSSRLNQQEYEFQCIVMISMRLFSVHDIVLGYVEKRL